MSNELTTEMEEQLKDAFKRKLYNKQYYIDKKSIWKEKYDTEESKLLKKEYYELNKEKRKEYQKKRYDDKLKAVPKPQTVEDIIIDKLFKEYL